MKLLQIRPSTPLDVRPRTNIIIDAYTTQGRFLLGIYPLEYNFSGWWTQNLKRLNTEEYI